MIDYFYPERIIYRMLPIMTVLTSRKIMHKDKKKADKIMQALIVFLNKVNCRHI